MSDEKLRSDLIRVASSLPKGSDERKKVLALLKDSSLRKIRWTTPGGIPRDENETLDEITLEAIVTGDTLADVLNAAQILTSKVKKAVGEFKGLGYRAEAAMSPRDADDIVLRMLSGGDLLIQIDVLFVGGGPSLKEVRMLVDDPF